MRRWKIFYITIMIMGILISTIHPIQAEEAVGYVYESLDVAVNINEQREYHVVETMQINFEEEMHGIIRNIAKAGDVERAEVNDIQVNGMPYEVDDRSDEVRVKIGDPSVTVSGLQEVTLSYTLSHHQDYDHTADYVYLNVLGTDYDTEIKQFHATITLFDGEQLKDFKVTSGKAGSRTNTLVKGGIQGHVLELTNKQTIQPFQGVTVQMRFPEGYFYDAPAYEYPYVINDNQMKVEVDDQQDFHVTQTLTYTSQSNHQRIQIPLISSLWKEDDYELLNVVVPEENNHHVVDQYLSITGQQGQHSVSITYDLHPYHMFDDTIILSFTNPEEDTKIEQFTLDLSMPVSGEIKVMLGRTGDELHENRYTLTQDHGTLKLKTNDSMEAAERLELAIPISSSDFHRSMNRSVWIGGFSCLGLLLVILLVRFGLFHRKKLVIPVNFQAPKGLNSAEAGYVIDLELSDVDITSLIFYWADQGYLRIHNINQEYSFEKIKDLDVSHPVYEHELFHAMFAHGSKGIVNKQELKGIFYLDVKEARKAITSRYTGNRSLISSSGKLLRAVLMYSSVIPFVLYVTLANYELYHSTMRAGVWLMIFVIFCMLFYGSFHQKGVNASIIAWIKRGMSLLVLVVILIMTNVGFSIPTLLITAGMLISIMLSHGIQKDSSLRESILIPLLGLKDFIELVEKDRLELLLEEDPQYYYHVLPYAQVLHVSHIWSDKFKDLTLEAPQWYVGQGASTVEDFQRDMNYVMFDMNATVTPPKSTHHYASSSSADHDSNGNDSFSSGGSVGGGSGGGGSRGW